MVFGLELERNGVTNRGIDTSGVKSEGVVTTDDHSESLLCRDGNNGNKSRDNSRETHFE